MIYSFVYINQWGNGDVVDVKELASDQEAMKHGRGIIESYIDNVVNDWPSWHGDWQDPGVVIDKYATSPADPNEDPIATACIMAEFNDSHDDVTYKETGFNE